VKFWLGRQRNAINADLDDARGIRDCIYTLEDFTVLAATDLPHDLIIILSPT
jgi:hypothetical protein